MIQHQHTSRSVVKWFFVLYVLFVVYGSLVPLRYVGRSLVDALREFQNIPFLVLGIESRADWIANGVLYIPVGFLTAAVLIQLFQKMPRALLFAFAGAFSMALAVAIEFTQLFFPARTVSLNDVLAECIGSLVGLAFVARYSDWFQAWLQSFLNGPQRPQLRLLETYGVVYFAFALFPYDILLSWSELAGKYYSNSWGWFVAGNSPRFMLATTRLLAEVALAVPFGLLLVRLRGSRSTTYKEAALLGLLLGLFIELAQFFIASGIAQGLSILSRIFGVCAGVALYKQRDHWNVENIAFLLRRYTLPMGAVYLMALLAINGWLVSHWQGLDVAEGHLAQLSLIPFYYHYFTTEAKALSSLALVCISYIPIGLLVWAHQCSPRFALIVALFLASCIEFGKLFLPQSHPDLTNLLLASTTGWFTVSLIRQLFPLEPASVEVGPLATASAQGSISLNGSLVWPLFTLAATVVWAATFPAFPVFVILVLIACAATVWRRPVWVFAIIPATLPVFDLAPWSGRFFIDEFDALLLVALTVALSRVPVVPRFQVRGEPLFIIAANLLALSFAISAVRGMLPFQLPDANSFNNYYSPYNALRIVKGVVWAFLVYCLSRRFVATGADVRRPFAWGMAIGLGLTVAVILWERVAFSGLWNFTDSYRVTGPFSAIHVGGAYIECFLAAATPFLVMLTLEKRHWFARSTGVFLLLATTYALMVTYSRNGYLAFGVAVAIMLFVVMRKTKRVFRSGVVLAALAGAMLVVAVPIFKGEFSQARLATVRADLGVRQAHWNDALSIRDTDWVTTLFGMGLGRYPETNFWRSAEGHRSGTYRLAAAVGNTYLRLGSGNSLYVEQLVHVQPGQPYVLKLDVRASVPNAQMTVPICEKWMLTSYNCHWLTLDLGKEFGAWRSMEARFTAKELSISPWYSQRPIKLSLYYAVPNSTIDVDNVRVEAEQGLNLLRNGDFSNGFDHWFFTTDGHLQWHLKSLYYGVHFDQGWFGLVALLAFAGVTLVRGAKNTLKGDTFSGAGMAAFSSFLVVGIFDTLIDAPRFLLLFALLAWACIYSKQKSMSRVKGP